jgi:hypothetical protein
MLWVEPPIPSELVGAVHDRRVQAALQKLDGRVVAVQPVTSASEDEAFDAHAANVSGWPGGRADRSVIQDGAVELLVVGGEVRWQLVGLVAGWRLSGPVDPQLSTIERYAGVIGAGAWTRRGSPDVRSPPALSANWLHSADVSGPILCAGLDLFGPGCGKPANRCEACVRASVMAEDTLYDPCPRGHPVRYWLTHALERHVQLRNRDGQP